MIIYPYKRGLASTAALRDAGAQVRYPSSNVIRGSSGPRKALAWGNREIPSWAGKVQWINHPSSVPLISDRRNWAAICDTTAGTVNMTTDRGQARAWLERDCKVLCRTIVNGSGGRGIVVVRPGEELPEAPMYSLYFLKQREYRVLWDSRLALPIHISTKRRVQGVQYSRDQRLIRSASNGWVFQVEEGMPEAVYGVCTTVGRKLAGLSLGFLAFDVAYNTEEDKAAVIEANSAPGLNEISAEKVMAHFDRS